MRIDKKRLVKNQEGFELHVDSAENPGLNFNRLTIGSAKPLHYVDDNGNKNCTRISGMDWGRNPWKACQKKHPLVRDQKGFTDHVDPRDNPGLDFDRLTTGSGEYLHYVDDNGSERNKRIGSMEWDKNPWEAGKTKSPLVRDQKGFADHVDPRDNPDLDFDRITTGSIKPLHYVDDNGNERNTRIFLMDWRRNPWKAGKTKYPLVRDQEGFSEHVDPRENPGLDFDCLTTGSNEYLHYVDDNGSKRNTMIKRMNWGINPWEAKKAKKPLVRDQEGFADHVDPRDNPGLDFDRLTIGCGEYLHYVDDNGDNNYRRICDMNWGWNPWKVEKINPPLVRDQKGFSDHVDPKDNPGLDFDHLTIGSDKPLCYVDDNENKSWRRIRHMIWKGNPWEPNTTGTTKPPLVRDQKGFSDHVDPKDNPGLDFDRLTIRSEKPLHYVDDNGNKSCTIIRCMAWGRNPWKAKRTKKPLVRDQEGFSEHVDPRENPGLDFECLTIGSNKYLHYVDDNGRERNTKISHMDWETNPWKAWERKPPLLKDQEGFSDHVEPEDNPGLDFNRLTIGSRKYLNYVDDSGSERHTRISIMDWGKNPWKEMEKVGPLVQDQEGFSDHVDLKENPDLNFDRLTIGSGKPLHYVDDKGNKCYAIIRYMNWEMNPWEAKNPPKPYVRDQEGFSDHVDLRKNPGLDFTSLTTGSNQRLVYMDDHGNERKDRVCDLDWEGDPWRNRYQKECVGEDSWFWDHCDETDPQKILFLKECDKWGMTTVKMHCDKGHHYLTKLKNYFNDVKEACPYCAGRLIAPGETDAVTEDPELEVFFVPEENNRDIHKVSPKETDRIQWKCPFCGYRFKKCLCLMVNRHPKCPACRDTGLVDDPSKLRKTDIPHMIIVRGEEDA